MRGDQVSWGFEFVDCRNMPKRPPERIQREENDVWAFGLLRTTVQGDQRNEANEANDGAEILGSGSFFVFHDCLRASHSVPYSAYHLSLNQFSIYEKSV